MKSVPWPPAVVLLVGAVLATVGVRAQRTLPLRRPLGDVVPATMEGFRGRELGMSPAEREAAGVTDYLFRTFENPDTTQGPRFFTLYVGYYNRQTSGKTIHSPKNCLPGAGWEPLTSQTASVATPSGPVTVNRYLIQNGRQQALVLYWYQGRGRVASNEYAVKWDLVRDAAVHHRSDEALVRVLVPVRGSEAAAFDLATRVASRLVPSLSAALPT